MTEGWRNIGWAIRDAREAKGLSQAELGKLADVGATTVSRIETSGNLNIATLRRIAWAIDSRTHVLIRYAENLDRLEEECGLIEKRREVEALECKVTKRAGRMRKTGKR